MRRLVLTLAISLGLASALSACRSPGPYGYAVDYVPTSNERTSISGAREYDPVMVAREPEAWRKGKTMLFGVVTARGPGPGGAASLTLSVRRLATRNLCANGSDEDTCRVTVSDKDFGSVHALVRLGPEDDVGETSIGIGSLLRVVGKLGEDVDKADGNPILRADFSRHWPRNTYVTNARADLMKQ